MKCLWGLAITFTILHCSFLGVDSKPSLSLDTRNEELLLERFRRDSEPELELLSSSTDETQGEGNCGDNEDLRDKCKEDHCPLDDKTVETCCSCMKVCCSSEDSQSKEDPKGKDKEMKGDDKGTKGDDKGMKAKVNDAVGKVEGFFKNVGSTVSKGVEDGWDKVKKTATDVKESVRQGINKGAEWVKNKTETGSKSSGNCKNSKDPKCSNQSDSTESSNEGGETPEPEPESSDSKKGKKRSSSESRPSNPKEMSMNQNMNMNMNKPQGGNYSSSGNQNSTPSPTPVPGMKKAKRETQVLVGSNSHHPPIWSSSVSQGHHQDHHHHHSESEESLESQENEDYHNHNHGHGTVTTHNTSTYTSTKLHNRLRRDVPPGMIAEQARRRAEDKQKMDTKPQGNATEGSAAGQMEMKGNGKNEGPGSRHRRGSGGADKMKETTSSGSGTSTTTCTSTSTGTNTAGSGTSGSSIKAPASNKNDKDAPRHNRASEKVETQSGGEMPCNNNAETKSKRSPAGPPANHKTMRTTTSATPYNSGKMEGRDPELPDPAGKEEKGKGRDRRSPKKDDKEPPPQIELDESSSMSPSGKNQTSPSGDEGGEAKNSMKNEHEDKH